jgi:flagellar motor switch protein FliN/FliY
MSGPTSQTAASGEGFEFLYKAFSDGLAASISTLLGRDVHVLAAPSGASRGAALWFHAEFAPVPNGALVFGGVREAWLGLGKQLLAAAGIDDPGSDLILSTLNETSAQVMGSIASALTRLLGQELSAKTSAPEASLTSSAQNYRSTSFRIRAEGISDVNVALLISPQLADLLVTKEPARTNDPALNTKNLELLMDVEMPVSISFGHAQLPLKDVMKLTTGSIVELNRSVSEPVDIVVNNCTVARGEVVVVEGNFGVRIKEVLSKEDRLKRLG